MTPGHLAEIDHAYKKHPLNAKSILRRIRRRLPADQSRLTERDLAIDEQSLITDQNHTGGIDAVREIALSLGMDSHWSVLDVGTGLGGTVRVLAHEFGCHCHGIELTRLRFRDAVALTKLVHLEHLVTFSNCDFMSFSSPVAFDAVIGQAAFMHFEDLTAALAQCRHVLKPQGRLVIEDGYLSETSPTALTDQRLQQAWDHWNGRYLSLEGWASALDEAGFQIIATRDLTSVALDEYQRMLARQAPQASASNEEIDGWRLGQSLIREGVIGMNRWICLRRDFSPPARRSLTAPSDG